MEAKPSTARRFLKNGSVYDLFFTTRSKLLKIAVVGNTSCLGSGILMADTLHTIQHPHDGHFLVKYFESMDTRNLNRSSSDLSHTTPRCGGLGTSPFTAIQFLSSGADR